ALAVLCGRPPADFGVNITVMKLSPPSVPVSMPVDLLLRRPDVRATEQQLISANAQIGVAQAAFYPSFRLMGTGGFEALDGAKLFDWQNRILSIAPSVSLPIFTGGRLKANLEATKSKYDEALAAYKQSWLIALREVEDALSDINGYSRQRTALAAAMQSAQD